MRVVGRLYPEPYSPRWQYNFVATLYGLLAVSLGLAIVFAFQLVDSRSESKLDVERDVWAKGEKAAAAVDQQISDVLDGFEVIADRVASGELGAGGADSEISSYLRDARGVRLGGLLRPSDEQIDRDLLIVYRRGSDNPGDIFVRRSEVDPSQHTSPATRFGPHLAAATAGTSGWLAPFLDTESDAVLAPFVVPVRFPGTAENGLLFIEVSLDAFKHVFAYTALGEAGYGFITDDQFRIVSHPETSLDASGIGLSSASGLSQSDLDDLVRNSGEDSDELISYSNEMDGSKSLLTLHRLPRNNWIMAYAAEEAQVLTRSDSAKQALMRLAAVGHVFLFIFLIVITRSYAGSLGGLWLLALSTGILFTAGILLHWLWFTTTPSNPEPSRVDLIDAINQHKAYLAEEFDDAESIDVNVGIALTSVEFTKLGSTIANADEAIIGGFIWWTCFSCPIGGFLETGDEYAEPIAQSFIFPEAREVSLEKLSGGSFQLGLEETDVFKFSAIVKRDFQPSHYPFDIDNVSLRIWPVNFDLEILLMPDIADYATLRSNDKPGLATDFKIAGWITEGTFFSYDVVEYNTTFGLQHSRGTERSTELLFNISVRRNFINAFITNILPVVVILALLFNVLMITPKTEKYALAFAGGAKSEGAGGGGSPTYTLIATSIVLAYTSALFFAVILAHSRLRNEIPADGILYLEYFYFAAYVSILAVTMNTLGFAAHRGGWLIHFRDNLIPRVAFWPLITMFLFAVSFVTFY